VKEGVVVNKSVEVTINIELDREKPCEKFLWIAAKNEKKGVPT